VESVPAKVEPVPAEVEPVPAEVEPAPAKVETPAPSVATVSAPEPAPQKETIAPPPEAVVATPVPALGDSDLPPILDKELLLEGFGNATSLVGTWTIEGDKAEQTDPEAFFAKLATPLIQDQRAYTYSFIAKSNARGRGWVGLGIHLFTPAFASTSKGYGAGNSLCVWLTRDPEHYSDNITRLQIYRSNDDWTMRPIADVPVKESIYDPNRFDVTVDPAKGTIAVSMDGSERLAVTELPNLQRGLYVVFRSLDTAEFSDFRAEAKK
jgi:hypothetical protein